MKRPRLDPDVLYAKSRMADAIRESSRMVEEALIAQDEAYRIYHRCLQDLRKVQERMSLPRSPGALPLDLEPSLTFILSEREKPSNE